MPVALDNTKLSLTALKKQLAGMFRQLLSRVYGGTVTQFLTLTVESDSHVQGLFRDGSKLLELDVDFDKDKFNYKFSDARQDSWLEGYLTTANAQPMEDINYFDDADIHLDRNKPPECTGNGLSCGFACIDPDEVCHINASKFISPSEMKQVKQVAILIKQATAPKPTVPADNYEEKTIRDLQSIAKDREVFRANHMTKVELIETLRALDKDPEHQNRLRRTLEKQRQSKREAKKAIQGTKLPANPALIWKQLQKIAKLAGTDPQTAALLAGAVLMGVGTQAYIRARDRYKSGLKESAVIALQRAKTTPLERINKPNVTLAVGGYASTGSHGQKMKELLEAPQDNTEGERWFKRKNQIIPITHQDFDIPDTAVSKRNTDGSYNPAYLGHVAFSSFGNHLRNLKQGRNDAAVDLAAKMYAYGAQNRDANLNILAHGASSNVVDEATEILHRMNPETGAKGNEIAKRFNIVRLGGANFGFAGNEPFWRNVNQRTITSSGDPFSFLPKKAPKWISEVKGHEIADYLNVSDVRENIREAFGYYTSSIKGQRREAARRKQTSEAIGGTLKAFGLGAAAKVWEGLDSLRETARENPLAAAIKGTGLLASTGALTYAWANDRRRSGLAAAADQASAIANSESFIKTVPSVQQSNYMFVVGGTGASAAHLEQKLVDAANKDGRSWLDESHHITQFDPDGRQDLPEGVDENPELAAAYALKEGFGRSINQAVVRGNNNDAIQLAAQLYAYGDKKQRVGKLPINIMAYGDGGLVGRQAIEILRRMDRKGGKTGAKIADRVRLVTLGTPGFGINYDPDLPETNIMGDRDPISRVPFLQRGQGLTESGRGVDGPSADAYLESSDVVGQIENSFRGNSKAHWDKYPRIQPKPKPKAETPPPAPKPPPEPRKLRYVADVPNPKDKDDPRNAADWSRVPEKERERRLVSYNRKLRDLAAASNTLAAGRAQKSGGQGNAPAPGQPTGGGSNATAQPIRLSQIVANLGLPPAPVSDKDPRFDPAYKTLSAQEKAKRLQAFAQEMGIKPKQ